MRKALDEVGEEVGRYIRLCNYCSGLCMPEIAAMGALEGLDVMLNDALYGILLTIAGVSSVQSLYTMTNSSNASIQESIQASMKLASFFALTIPDNPGFNSFIVCQPL